MEMTIGSLELNRTNPAHLGTKPLGVTEGFSEIKPGAVARTGTDSFESYLLEAVELVTCRSEVEPRTSSPNHFSP